MYLQKLILLTLLIHSSLLAWTNYGGNDFYDLNVNKNFTELVNKNVYGDFVATGDSILYVNDGSTPNLIDSNTSYKMDMNISQFTSASDVRRRNSSTSVLNLPSYVQGSDIIWAGLFWQGHINERGITALTNDMVDANVSGYDTVTIVAQDGTIDSTLVSSKTYYTASRDADDFRYFYGAYVDVTSFVSANYSSANNEFTVGNIMTTAGLDTGSPLYINNSQTDPKLFLNDTTKFGYYGGWSLIVIYNITDTQIVSDNDVKLNNVAIFDGYDLFLTWGDGDVEFLEEVIINGFYTPLDGNISSKMLLFGGAGDKNLGPDILQFLDTNSSFRDLSNASNPNDNQFNHTYTNLGLDMDTNSTTITNKQGMDLDIYDISDYMENGQSSATIKFGTKKVGTGFSGSSDQLFPQVIGFSTELFQPTFCYDYAYKQNGKYFTQDYNRSVGPTLFGSNILTGADNPISISLFIRNTVNSDINVTDLNVSITNIDSTQVNYINDTTYIAKNSALSKTLVNKALTDIELGIVSSNEFIYVYYDLEPLVSDINMSIKVTLDYILNINGTDISYTSNIPSVDIPLCNSNGVTSYDAISGVFNIVDTNNYDYDEGGLNRYYNLPTQIVKREGNFKLLSLADDGVFDTLEARSTIVAIDMIDVSAFQSTYASCNELTTSITDDKIWITLDNNASKLFNQQTITDAISEGMTSLTVSSQFYKMARRNTAFRVTYNIANDVNKSLVKTSIDVNGNYSIDNFADLALDYSPCNQTGISKLQLKVCMDDIYGDNTRAICSRDNFSIRPEAFLIKFNDQDQENSATPKVRFSDQVSGLSSPTPTITHLAAGYNYNMQAIATDFLGNSSSYGYTKQFDSSSIDPAKYFWEPRNSHVVSGCNEIIDKRTYVRFTNGAFDDNSSIGQVGEYKFNITDTHWTAVDNDPTYMEHHVAPYFILPVGTPNTTDCTPNSTASQLINSVSVNGCDISSSHTNINVNLVYNDYNITSHPYKFILSSITPTIALNHTATTADNYIYMADVSQDENMSFHLNGSIQAAGYNNADMENFVNECYAEPLILDINKSTINTAVAYQSIFHTEDENSTIIRTTIQDLNNTSDTIATLNGDFLTALNGAASTILNLNFNRTVNTAVNPQEITFISYNARCSVAANCSFNANLINDETSKGTLDLNNTRIKHYYGRTNAPKQRFVGNTGTTFIYYEVYCSGTDIGGQVCDKSLLPNGLDSNTTDDPRWFVNVTHTAVSGTGGSVNQKGQAVGAGSVVGTATTGNSPDSTNLAYDASNGYVYKTTMENNASTWLIYNKYDINANRNEFQVEFDNVGSAWAGEHETNTTTNPAGSSKTNRRTMW